MSLLALQYEFHSFFPDFFSPYTVKYTTGFSAKNVHHQFSHEFCWWKNQAAWEILIFHCTDFLSVVKQPYKFNTGFESKFGFMIAAPIVCVFLLWQPGSGSEVYF